MSARAFFVFGFFGNVASRQCACLTALNLAVAMDWCCCDRPQHSSSTRTVEGAAMWVARGVQLYLEPVCSMKSEYRYFAAGVQANLFRAAFERLGWRSSADFLWNTKVAPGCGVGICGAWFQTVAAWATQRTMKSHSRCMIPVAGFSTSSADTI